MYKIIMDGIPYIIQVMEAAVLISSRIWLNTADSLVLYVRLKILTMKIYNRKSIVSVRLQR